MKYSIWFRKDSVQRIPECVILDKDYEYLGEIEADTKGSLYHAIKNNTDPDMTFSRNLQTGDVVMNTIDGVHWVWTERGIWAIVMVISDSGYRSIDDEEDY